MGVAAHPDPGQRALLVFWPPGPAPGIDPDGLEFATLRDAVAAAGASAAAEGRPWIVTEDGAILSPLWIEAALTGEEPAARPR